MTNAARENRDMSTQPTPQHEPPVYLPEPRKGSLGVGDDHLRRCDQRPGQHRRLSQQCQNSQADQRPLMSRHVRTVVAAFIVLAAVEVGVVLISHLHLV
jgi:hypothetical protein